MNLALSGLVFFYAMFLALEVVLRTMCGQMGIDYCDYVSAGIVANQAGYVKIYDIQLLDQVQKQQLPPGADPAWIPVDIFPYLPIFVLPFQALALLPPELSFWIWTIIKVGAFILYLGFFARNLDLKPRSVPFLLFMFASLPVFQNIFSGQVDAWLAICIGEFMRALIAGRRFKAGLWLGGLLLKPQALVLIGLVLLLQRSTRVIAGLVVAGMSFLLASLALIGPKGLADLAGLYLLYFKGHPSNLVCGMANWRMLGQQVADLSTPWLGYTVAGVGIASTLVLGFLAWRKPMPLGSPAFVGPLLGILAATTMVAWHSHIFMAMIMIPPLMYLYSTGAISQRALAWWVLLPALVYAISIFVPEAMAKIRPAGGDLTTPIYVTLGLVQFVANASLFLWSIQSSVSMRPDTPRMMKPATARD